MDCTTGTSSIKTCRPASGSPGLNSFSGLGRLNPASGRVEWVIGDFMKLIYGDRIGKRGVLRVGASSIIFDESREKVLLTKRTDNGRWCLPGGGMDPGEGVEEACIREAYEETGLHVRVARLVGVYTSPDMVIEYADGEVIQPVAFSFEVEVTGGEMGLSDETTDVGYFTMKEVETLDLMEHHRARIQDALQNVGSTFIR